MDSEMVCDQGKIRESERHTPHCRHVDPVIPSQVFGFHLELIDLELAWIRIQHLSHDHERQGYESRHQEHDESQPEIAVLKKQDSGDDQGAQHGADLVHGLMQPIGPAASDLRAGVGEHRVPRRRPDRLPETLGDDKHGRQEPVAGQGQQRHGKEVDGVSDKREEPIPFCFISQVSGNDSEGISDELAESGHKPDQSRASAQEL